jgi:uncharacterized protein YndB with AHSA1/START domain
MGDKPVEINIVREFDAPRELVWRAWTEPEQFADWFGGKDAEIPMSTVSMDVRPGGEWRATMLAGPAGEIPWHGSFQEVVPPERLVFTIADRPGDVYEVCTVVLTELGERTQMAFTQGGGHIPPEILEQTTAGWHAFFDRMGELVASA